MVRGQDQLAVIGRRLDGRPRQLGRRYAGREPEADRRRPALAVAELVRAALGDDRAARDDRDPVGEPLRLVHVVRGQEHGLAEVAQAGDHVPGLPARRGVEAGRRLVEKEEVRIADQRDADVEPSKLSSGEGAGAGVGPLAEPDVIDRPLDGERLAVVAGVEVERLADGELGPHPALLEDDPDPLPPLAAGRSGVGSEHRDLTRAAVAVALEDLDRGRLPGTVRPQEREHLPGPDLELDPAHRLELAIGLAEAGDDDDGLAHPSDSMERPIRSSRYPSSTSRWTTRTETSSRAERWRAIRSATVTERWRPPVQPIAIVRCVLPSAM